MSLTETQIAQIRDDIALESRTGIDFICRGKFDSANMIECWLEGMRKVIRRLGEESLLSDVENALIGFKEAQKKFFHNGPGA